jgi:hypothetical protein
MRESSVSGRPPLSNACHLCTVDQFSEDRVSRIVLWKTRTSDDAKNPVNASLPFVNPTIDRKKDDDD